MEGRRWRAEKLLITENSPGGCRNSCCLHSRLGGESLHLYLSLTVSYSSVKGSFTVLWLRSNMHVLRLNLFYSLFPQPRNCFMVLQNFEPIPRLLAGSMNLCFCHVLSGQASAYLNYLYENNLKLSSVGFYIILDITGQAHVQTPRNIEFKYT